MAQLSPSLFFHFIVKTSSLCNKPLSLSLSLNNNITASNSNNKKKPCIFGLYPHHIKPIHLFYSRTNTLFIFKHQGSIGNIKNCNPCLILSSCPNDDQMMINQYGCLLHSTMCQTEWSNNTIGTLSLLVYLRIDQEILL